VARGESETNKRTGAPYGAQEEGEEGQESSDEVAFQQTGQRSQGWRENVAEGKSLTTGKRRAFAIERGPEECEPKAKKVKTLPTKSLSSKQASGVKGGAKSLLKSKHPD
jgi:hypothetical protein